MKKAILVAGLLAVTAWSALLQAQVAGSGTGSNDLLVSMYNQLEALQQEVQTLRGIVEEQSNRLRRLETETRDRYLDMDNRLRALSVGSAAPGMPTDPALGDAGVAVATSPQAVQDVRTNAPFNPVAQNADLGSPSAVSNAAATSAAPQGAVLAAGVDAAANQMSEQDLYRSALNLLLEEGKAEESAATFQVYLQRFPDGRLLPNALYWQGEALILLSRYPEALSTFERVLNEFPGDAKAAGALLKTGVVQNLLGNRSAAENIWRELPGRFPDSASEITLARDYLSRP